VLEVALYHEGDPRMLVSSPVGPSVDALRVRSVWDAPPSHFLENCHSLTHERSCQRIGAVPAHDAHLAIGENAEVGRLLLADQVMEARVGKFPAEALRSRGVSRYLRPGGLASEGKPQDPLVYRKNVVAGLAEVVHQAAECSGAEDST
jgi:hypothetical protein